MRRRFGLWCCAAAVSGLALVAGCEKKDQTTVTPPTGGTAPTTMPSSSSSSSMSGQMDRMAASGAAATQQAAGAASGAMADAQAQGSAAAQGTTAQAQTLLDQTMTYIRENKWDLAEQSLTKLEAMKPQLPAEWRPRVDQARAALNSAKAGGSLKDAGSGLLQGIQGGGTSK